MKNEKSETQIIDMTPTWRGILPAILDTQFHDAGSSIEDTHAELVKMCAVAIKGMTHEQARYSTELRQALTVLATMADEANGGKA